MRSVDQKCNMMSMKPKYIPSRDLPVFRSERVQRRLFGAIVLRTAVPGIFVGAMAFNVAQGVIAMLSPKRELYSAPVVIGAALVGLLVFILVGMIGFGLFVRWLVRYRTARRGREVALRQVLKPNDNRPSAWRRMWLTFYGVRREEINMAQRLWR
jgi:hypothetical protein